MPKADYLSTTDAREALDSYVFSTAARVEVPKTVNPADLPEYLEGVIVEELKEPYCWGLFHVMDHYDTHRELQLFEDYLNREERDAKQFGRSLCYTLATASIGRGSQRDEALSYYEYLLAHRLANEHFDRLIDCYAVLLVDLKPASPEPKIREELSRAERQAQTSEAAELKEQKLDELLEADLPEAAEDVEFIKKLLRIQPPTRRYRALAEAYVGFNADLGPVGERWIERTLRRDGRANGPDVVQAIREMLAAPQFKGVDREHTRMMQVRALRAIDFFEGALDKKELKLMEKKHAGDSDPLCWF